MRVYSSVCGKRDNYVAIEVERIRARVYEINRDNVCA